MVCGKMLTRRGNNNKTNIILKIKIDPWFPKYPWAEVCLINLVGGGTAGGNLDVTKGGENGRWFNWKGGGWLDGEGGGVCSWDETKNSWLLSGLWEKGEHGTVWISKLKNSIWVPFKPPCEPKKKRKFFLTLKTIFKSPEP